MFYAIFQKIFHGFSAEKEHVNIYMFLLTYVIGDVRMNAKRKIERKNISIHAKVSSHLSLAGKTGGKEDEEKVSTPQLTDYSGKCDL